jgi:hypothetical protein
MSATIVTAVPPSLAIRAVVASALGRSRSATTTRAPSRANSTAIARPLPIGGSVSP